MDNEVRYWPDSQAAVALNVDLNTSHTPGVIVALLMVVKAEVWSRFSNEVLAKGEELYQAMRIMYSDEYCMLIRKRFCWSCPLGDEESQHTVVL
ncbi:hypothetical protein Pmani_030248 [Petrolisthes manimaculis]|uniref:Uncharacterized protein n=1 Tax=Petrolisthes manimaculis TaxID=1843537 RepID=A0AAE1NX35_9EUCA|nr:hypothetical protein Pmani_030248 [Petrolisthes manimaculis]